MPFPLNSGVPDAGLKVADFRFETVESEFDRLTLSNAPVEVLATGFRWIEGLVWMGDWGTLLFQDLPRGRTMAWSEHGGLAVWREPSGNANGQARDREGRVVACVNLDRAVVRVEHDGSVTTLATHFQGRRLNSPNDIAVKSDGSIWFTDPHYGISNDYEGVRQVSELAAAVYRLAPESGDLSAVSHDFEGPNGLAFSPDEKLLYVAETGDQTRPDPTQVLRVLPVSADGRSLGPARDVAKVSSGYTDGMAVDEAGRIWSSAGDGIHCLSPNGQLLGRIRLGLTVSNLTFGGGQRLNRLFIGASHTLMAVFLNTRGARWP